MARYMLDTDTATYVIRGKMPALDERIASVATGELCISAVTRGELLYGIKLKTGAQRLSRLVDEFLERVWVFLGCSCGHALCDRRGGAASSRHADRHHGHYDCGPRDRAEECPGNQQ